jgi:serine/threonine-protein kinase HipA
MGAGSPAYDLCHAYRPGSEWVSQHSLSINGKRNEITKTDLLRLLGNPSGAKRASEIIDEIDTTVNQWKRFADEVSVKPSMRDHIAKTLLKL